MSMLKSPSSRTRLVLAVLTTLALAAGPAAAQSTVVTVSPATGSFDCDGSWQFDLAVDAGTVDLRGFSLVLAFDDAILQPVAVSVGAQVAGAACPYFLDWSVDGGALSVNVANLGCSSAGPGVVLSVVVEGLISGTSTFSVLSGTMRTGTNQPIGFTSAGASVTADCAVVSESTDWGSLKAAYR